MHLLLVAVFAAAPIVLQALRLRAVVRAHGVAIAGGHLLAALCLHVAFACEAAALSVLLPPGVVFALATFVLAVDFWVFSASGFRLQWYFVRLYKDADLFAQPGWRVKMALLAAGCVALGAFVRGQGDVLLLPVAVALVVVGVVILRRLPEALSYEWDNRFIGAQLALLARLRSGRASSAMPRLFAPQNEVSTVFDHALPLWRETTAWTGERAVAGGVPKDKTPHVIVFFMESFAAREVSPLITPHFLSLTKEGAFWERFYTNGYNTSEAAIATLFGVPPSFVVQSTPMDPRAPSMVGLADILRGRGYLPAVFNAANLTFDNGCDFYLDHGFARVFGPHEMMSSSERVSWGIFDEDLVRFHTAWLGEQKQPTFSVLFSITNHGPWKLPPGVEEIPLDVPRESFRHKFLQTMHYSDRCLGEYVNTLREKGLADDVVLLVLGDTGVWYEEDSVRFACEMRESAMRVPLLLWAPAFVPAGQHTSAIGSQVDVLPTLLDLLSLPAAHHAVGTSLLRHAERRHAYLVRWAEPSFVGMRIGDQRFNHTTKTARSTLYAVDPATHEEGEETTRKLPELLAQCREETDDARAFFAKVYRDDALAKKIERPALTAGVWAEGIEPEPPLCPTSVKRVRELIARPPKDAFETKLFSVWREYLMSGLLEADVLRLVQLRYKRLQPQRFGAFSRVEEEDWQRLDAEMERVAVERAEQLLNSR